MNITHEAFLKHYNEWSTKPVKHISDVNINFNGFELFQFIRELNDKYSLNNAENTEIRRLVLEQIKAISDQRRAVMENVKKTFSDENIKTLVEYYAKRIKLLQNILILVRIDMNKPGVSTPGSF